VLRRLRPRGRGEKWRNVRSLIDLASAARDPDRSQRPREVAGDERSKNGLDNPRALSGSPEAWNHSTKSHSLLDIAIRNLLSTTKSEEEARAPSPDPARLAPVGGIPPRVALLELRSGRSNLRSPGRQDAVLGARIPRPDADRAQIPPRALTAPCRGGERRGNSAAQASGISKRKVAPCPSWLFTDTVPPCKSTMCLTMERPRPVPPFSRERALSTR